jgi:hypothetical protein
VEQLVIEHLQLLVGHLGERFECSAGGVKGQGAVEEQAMLARMVFCGVGAEILELKTNKTWGEFLQELCGEVVSIRFDQKPFPNPI